MNHPVWWCAESRTPMKKQGINEMRTARSGGWAAHLQKAVRAVREAGRIQKRSFNAAHTVVFKSETDLVTEVDHACERAVVRILKKAFPDHDLLLEETCLPQTGSPYQWVVDPLDGTTNYTHRYPHFCCSVALRHQGKTVLGAVLDPFRDELFTATRGQGAYLNGRSIRVSRETRLIRCLVGTGFPCDMREAEDNNLDTFCTVVPEVRSIRRSGCAALDLCYLAAGRLDGYWVVELAPWDTAAGVLIIQEAGGRVTDRRGGKNTDGTSGLVGSNGRIHGKLMRLLRGS